MGPPTRLRPHTQATKKPITRTTRSKTIDETATPAAGTRVDAWLWAVRLYKTRSTATSAVRAGHVRVNRAPAKASTHVKVGDRVEAFVERARILEVVTVIDKRVGAAVAATCLVDHSPPVPVVKRLPRVAVRAPGAGRPTKRERRELDRFRRP